MKRNLWYINSLERIGLTVPQGAHFFGVNERTNRRWVNGERCVPRAVELVFWLMDRQGLKATDIPQPSSDVEFYKATSTPVAFTRPAGYKKAGYK
ncbi:MAG TPA: hypothetical protein VIG52_11905 [Methyloceanibacter sp.]